MPNNFTTHREYLLVRKTVSKKNFVHNEPRKCKNAGNYRPRARPAQAKAQVTASKNANVICRGVVGKFVVLPGIVLCPLIHISVQPRAHQYLKNKNTATSARLSRQTVLHRPRGELEKMAGTHGYVPHSTGASPQQISNAQNRVTADRKHGRSA